MSDDVVSAEKAQQVIDAVNAACELGDMSSTEEAAALTMESLARTVVTLHRELAVLRAQLGPLCAVHDALVAAAALPGAGASPEAMVAAVRAQGAREMRAALDAAEREHATDCDLSARQAGILTAVPDALKGPPSALSSHSHHDLGDVARRVVAERDEARAEVARLRGEVATARREGAHEMRERAVQAALWSDGNCEAADAIRALPLDAPGGER